MHCFNRLNFNFEDISKVKQTDLIAKIIEEFYNKTTQAYSAFILPTHEILQYKFKLFLGYRHLHLMPHVYVLICKPFTKGVTHIDYLSNMVYDPFINNLPEFPNSFTNEQAIYHTNRNQSQSYHVSFHVQLTQSGSMDWFNETTKTSIYLTEENKIPFLTYKGDQLLTLCDQLTDTGVSICRSDVLHLSNNEFSDRPRIVLVFKFVGNPTFEQVKTKLQDFVIERE